MFKKFHPKDDVSSSTSLKSSVQRGIRTAVLAQMPLLTEKAYKDDSAPSASDPTTGQDDEAGGAGGVEDEVSKKDKGGKKAKGEGKKKGGGGKNKKDKEKGQDKEDGSGQGQSQDEEGEVMVIDEIWPKKEALGLTKCHDRISIYTINSVPIFVQHFDGPFVPTLKLLHRFPGLLPHVQIDRGAIKFLLAGANMMAPGLLSPGGNLPDGLAQDTLVAIHAEGKEHACGIGKMVASSEEVKKAGKGVAVEVVTWIGDDLWKVDTIGL